MIGVPKPPVHARDTAFIAWLHGQPCVVCGDRLAYGFDRIEAAHLQSVRYGDVENAVSLCGSRHHREGKDALHQLGRAKFERRWKVNLHYQAIRLYAKYRAERRTPLDSEGTAVNS